jgi:hypothetical protein
MKAIFFVFVAFALVFWPLFSFYANSLPKKPGASVDSPGGRLATSLLLAALNAGMIALGWWGCVLFGGAK